MKHTGQESGGELCEIAKLWSFLQTTSANCFRLWGTPTGAGAEGHRPWTPNGNFWRHHYCPQSKSWLHPCLSPHRANWNFIQSQYSTCPLFRAVAVGLNWRHDVISFVMFMIINNTSVLISERACGGRTRRILIRWRRSLTAQSHSLIAVRLQTAGAYEGETGRQEGAIWLAESIF